MLKLNEFRTLYPEYNDMSDADLTSAVYAKSKRNQDYDTFAREFGLQSSSQEAEGPTFSDKVVNTGKAIAEGITFIPGQIADTLRDAYHGGDIDVTDTQALQERRARDDERAAYVQKYKDKAFDGAPDAMTSIGYSAATMGALVVEIPEKEAPAAPAGMSGGMGF